MSASLILTGCAANTAPTLQSNTPAQNTPPAILPEPDLPKRNISLQQPDLSEPLKSPVKIKGTASGNYFFEGTFSIVLKDGDGKVIGRSNAHADDDWMQPGPVKFSATLKFAAPKTQTGMLVFEKDNPSGLAENAYSEEFKIIFSGHQPKFQVEGHF